MLIVVAPTLPQPTTSPANPPDLTCIRAFVAPLDNPLSQNTAVTYAPGTWHAPMIVLGSKRVDFLVTQFANGVTDDDVQEVLIGSGPDEAILSEQETKVREYEGLRSVEVEIDIDFVKSGWNAENAELRHVMEKKWTTDEAVTRAVNATRKSRL